MRNAMIQTLDFVLSQTLAAVNADDVCCFVIEQC